MLHQGEAVAKAIEREDRRAELQEIIDEAEQRLPWLADRTELARRDLQAMAASVNTAEAEIFKMQGALDLAGDRAASLDQERERAGKLSAAQLFEAAGVAPERRRFIDCRGSALVIEPGGVRIERSALKRKLAASLGDVEHVTILVRPDGFDTFIEAEALLKEARREARVGYLPVRSDWEFDFAGAS